MSNFAPLGTDWLPWHFQRIYNFSEYLKLNGYFANYGFSIWSSCEDCSLDAGNGENKIYLSSHFFSHLPYLIINHYFGAENLKLYGNLVNKIVIISTGILISELLIKLHKNKNELKNFSMAILCFIFFIVNPWTYKMIIAHWTIIFFLFFFLLGILLFLNNRQNIGLLLFFISGLFSLQSSAGAATFYTLILLILYIKKKHNLLESYFPNMHINILLSYKIIFSLFLPVFFYFFLKFIALGDLISAGGSSILTRIGISGNDIHNGGLLGAVQFLGGNRITQCIINFDQGLEIDNLSRSIFLYNCILATFSMILVSLISIFGLFILYKAHNSFYKLVMLPIIFLLLSFLFLLQQSSSVHLMGYSYFFSAIFSVGLAVLILRILEKYNFSIIAIVLTIPTTIGIIFLCIRVSMLTGINS